MALLISKKRTHTELEALPTLSHDPKRTKSDGRTSLQHLSLRQQPHDPESHTPAFPSSSPTLIASSSSASSQSLDPASDLDSSSDPSGSSLSIPDLLSSSPLSTSSQDSASDSSSDPSSSSLEPGRRPVLIMRSNSSPSIDTDSSSSSTTSSAGSSSSSSSGAEDAAATSSSGSDDDNTSSSTSSSSSSSLNPSPVTTLQTHSAPPRPPLTSQNLSTLQSRLSSFIPAIHAANQTLEEERAEGKLAERDIENVEEGGRAEYIEMDLGLGVLEEKKKVGEVGSEDLGNEELEGSEGGERNVLGRLMGRKRRGKPGIEVLGGV